MRMAEDEGTSAAATPPGSILTGFRRAAFYERLGYTVFGTLDGEPPAFPRYFLKKALADPLPTGRGLG